MLSDKVRRAATAIVLGAAILDGVSGCAETRIRSTLEAKTLLGQDPYAPESSIAVLPGGYFMAKSDFTDYFELGRPSTSIIEAYMKKYNSDVKGLLRAMDTDGNKAITREELKKFFLRYGSLTTE